MVDISGCVCFRFVIGLLGVGWIVCFEFQILLVFRIGLRAVFVVLIG